MSYWIGRERQMRALCLRLIPEMRTNLIREFVIKGGNIAGACEFYRSQGILYFLLQMQTCMTGFFVKMLQ